MESAWERHDGTEEKGPLEEAQAIGAIHRGLQPGAMVRRVRFLLDSVSR